mmetsp:Transcript_14062/g.32734  ORF Transcript_14062/g.32734 Transcript_14062/m.32734 type:complete len:449 (-) Transcript_14062:207-1553(-)
MGGLHVREPCLLEVLDVLDGDAIAVSLDTDEERRDDLFGFLRFVLSLLEEFVQTDTTVQLLLGGGIQIGTELGECGDLTVLGEFELHGTGDGGGGLVLSGGSDTGDRETDGNGGTLTLVEELGFQENLSIGNGNNIRGNVGGHISSLGLNDGKGGERSSTESNVHLGGTFQKTGVEVENISGVGLTTRRTTKQQRHLTVGNGLLRQIIVEDHGVLAVVTEVLSHGSTGVRSKELKRGGIGGGSGDNDAVVHGATFIELSDELGDGRSLLSDTDVDTGEGIGLGLLVDNCINGNGGLSGLTITDNQLSLSTSDGNQGIDGLESGKHRFGNGLTGDDTGGLDLGTRALYRFKRSSSVDGLSDTVHNTSEKFGTDGDIDDGSGTGHVVTFQNVTIITEDDNTDVVRFQVQSHPAETAGEHNHLSSLNVGETVDTGDTISDGDDGTGFGVLD